MTAARERSYPTTLEEIRPDHRLRYEWAAERIAPGSRVIDAASGSGYGSAILAKRNCVVLGFDVSGEAVAFAREHWQPRNVTFYRADLHRAPMPECDVVVSFETIEHLKRPKRFLRQAAKAAPRLLVSVPNEDNFPFRNGGANPFHFRHYTKSQLRKLLARCGWRIESWHGQIDKRGPVVPDLSGRTLIADCVRENLK